MEFIYSYIKNICVFMLVITLILNIFPDRQYKKYIKLFAGLLLMSLVFKPFVRVKDIQRDINKKISEYSRASFDINLGDEVMELETKMYERASKEYYTEVKEYDTEMSQEYGADNVNN